VRRLLPALVTGAVLLGVAGCDDGAAAAPPAPPVSTDAQVDDVGTAVQDAEQLLNDIDAELAADDASGD
jgi:hypothetical protein